MNKLSLEKEFDPDWTVKQEVSPCGPRPKPTLGFQTEATTGKIITVTTYNLSREPHINNYYLNLKTFCKKPSKFNVFDYLKLNRHINLIHNKKLEIKFASKLTAHILNDVHVLRNIMAYMSCR